MKKQILNSLTTAFFLSLVIFISCGGGNDDEPNGPTAAEEQFEKLAKSWTVTSAQADGRDVEGWTGLVISFSGTPTAGTYSVVGDKPEGTDQVWPASGGSWTFKSEEDVNTIVRSDGVEISVAVSEEAADGSSTATLSFNIEDSTGRTEVVEGSWVFTLSNS